MICFGTALMERRWEVILAGWVRIPHVPIRLSPYGGIR